MKTQRLIARVFLLALVGAIGVSASLPAFAEQSIEERTSQAVNDILVQQGAPVLQALIARSRDKAVRAGVLPIPVEIRQHLVGFIPDVVLDAARYRVQGEIEAFSIPPIGLLGLTD